MKKAVVFTVNARLAKEQSCALDIEAIPTAPWSHGNFS